MVQLPKAHATLSGRTLFCFVFCPIYHFETLRINHVSRWMASELLIGNICFRSRTTNVSEVFSDSTTVKVVIEMPKQCYWTWMSLKKKFNQLHPSFNSKHTLTLIHLYRLYWLLLWIEPLADWTMLGLVWSSLLFSIDPWLWINPKISNHFNCFPMAGCKLGYKVHPLRVSKWDVSEIKIHKVHIT